MKVYSHLLSKLNEASSAYCFVNYKVNAINENKSTIETSLIDSICVYLYLRGQAYLTKVPNLYHYY